jgi:molybdopterin-dependent oxidoreductase alpha subunit
VLAERGWVDEKFLAEHCTGWEEVSAECRRHPAEDLVRRAGVPWSSIEGFAELLHTAKKAVLVWSMGITQHPHGADGVQMILNLALSQGWLGREGCGVMPIRGHSSVQGGAEMGAYATAFPGVRSVNAENARALSAQYGFTVPDWLGFTAVEMVEACARGALDVFYCLGGNFLRTLPEPDYVAQAMARVPLRIHQDIILTDQMFIEPEGDVLLLPAQTRYEQDDGGTETSTERRVMFSPEIPRQVGEARAEWKILRDLALRVRPECAEAFGCATGWEVRAEIARIVPMYDGIQHLRTTGDAFQYGGAHLCPGGVCPTFDGRAHLRAVPLPEPRPAGCFHVSTRRGKQFNTLIYAEIDPLTGAPRDAIFMSGEDADAHHLKHGDRIALVNDLGRYEGRVFIADLAPGNLQVMWPEGNVIIRRGVVDAGGGVPDYNAQVRIEPAAEASRLGCCLPKPSAHAHEG